MSNVFEVASHAAPYEKVVVGKNLKYVIETLRAEGTSPWFAASHDEFAVVLDGEIDVHFIKPSDGPLVDAQTEGSVRLEGKPVGPVDGLCAAAPRPSGAAARGRSLSLRSGDEGRAARADDPRTLFGREVGRYLHPVNHLATRIDHVNSLESIMDKQSNLLQNVTASEPDAVTGYRIVPASATSNSAATPTSSRSSGRRKARPVPTRCTPTISCAR